MPKQDHDEAIEFKRLTGERVKALREQRGMSQRELAAAASVSHEALRSYESGGKAMSLWVAVKIARGLKKRSVLAIVP
jgi:DNA-binding XRE family transcriptional regulator